MPRALKTLLILLLGVVLGAALMTLVRHRSASAVSRPYAPTPAEAALEQVVPRVDLEQVSFGDAMAIVRRLTRVPVEVETEELKRSLEPHPNISVHLSKVSVAHLIGTILAQARGSAGDDVSFAPRAGCIVVSTSDRLRCTNFWRCYDVRDLLTPDPWDRSLQAASHGTVSEAPATTAGGTAPLTSRSRSDELASLIEATISNDSWTDNGGSAGVLSCIDGRLFVWHGWAEQRQVERLLDQIRHLEPPTSRLRDRRPAREAINRLLHKVVPLVQIDAAPLDDAAWALGQMFGANIVVDWRKLHGIGVEQPFRVSADLKDATLPTVLNVMFQGSLADAGLGYGVDEEGVIWITTRDTAARFVTTMVHDLSDFIPAPGKPPPKPERFSMLRVIPRDDEGGKDGPTAPGELADALCSAIEDDVDYDSWLDNGGPAASLTVVRQSLVVTQTWANHQKIERLLDDLRHPKNTSRTPNHPASSPATQSSRQVQSSPERNGAATGARR